MFQPIVIPPNQCPHQTSRSAFLAGLVIGVLVVLCFVLLVAFLSKDISQEPTVLVSCDDRPSWNQDDCYR